MMKEPVTFDAYLDEKLKNPEFKKEWDALEPEFQIIRAIIEGREARHMTRRGHRHQPGQHQPAGKRHRQPIPAHPQAAGCRPWDEAEAGVYPH